jgi:hypothetical protein
MCDTSLKLKIACFEQDHFQWDNEIESIEVELLEPTDTHYVANVVVEEVNGDRNYIDEAQYPKDYIDKAKIKE